MEIMTILVIGSDPAERANLLLTIRNTLPTTLRVLEAGAPGEALAALKNQNIDCVVATHEAAADGWREFVDSWTGANPALREMLFIVAPPPEEMLSQYRMHRE